MPRLTRRNKRLHRLFLSSPRLQSLSTDKFRPIIHPHHTRTLTTLTGNNIQQFHNSCSINSGICCKPDMLTGELIHHVADLD